MQSTLCLKQTINIKLFGPFQIVGNNDVDLTPSGKRAKAIVAMLVLSGTGTCHRKWVQEKLWSARSAPQAAASLRQELSNLKRHFRDRQLDLIIVERDTVSLATSAYDIRTDNKHGQRQLLEGLSIPDPSFNSWLATHRLQQSRARTLAPAIAPTVPVNSLPQIRINEFSATCGSDKSSIFAAGLTEELLTVLGKMSAGFRLLHPSSPKKEHLDELILEGSVRVSGTTRVTTRLYSTKHQCYLWSTRMDYDSTSVFDAQEKICKSIVESTQGSLSNEDWSTSWSKTSSYGKSCFLAWENYQIGRYHENQVRRESLLKAIEYYAAALKIDASFLPAKVATGFCKLDLYRLCWTDTPQQLLKEVQDLAAELRCDSSQPYSTALKAFVQSLKGYHEEAHQMMEQSLRRAQTITPELLGYYGVLLGYAGNFSEESIQYKKALALTQYPPLWIRPNLALALVGVDNPAAIEQCKQVLDYDPDQPRALIFIIAALASQDLSEARLPEYVARLLKIEPEFRAQAWASINRYKNPADFHKIAALLASAGLP